MYLASLCSQEVLQDFLNKVKTTKPENPLIARIEAIAQRKSLMEDLRCQNKHPLGKPRKI